MLVVSTFIQATDEDGQGGRIQIIHSDGSKLEFGVRNCVKITNTDGTITEKKIREFHGPNLYQASRGQTCISMGFTDGTVLQSNKFEHIQPCSILGGYRRKKHRKTKKTRRLRK
jgi:hypothetical protein